MKFYNSGGQGALRGGERMRKPPGASRGKLFRLSLETGVCAPVPIKN
jgi:hypothetical protein